MFARRAGPFLKRWWRCASCATSGPGTIEGRSVDKAISPEWLNNLRAAQRSRDPGAIQTALSGLDWQRVASHQNNEDRRAAVQVVLQASSRIGNPDIAILALQCLEFSELLGLEGDEIQDGLGSRHYSMALSAFAKSAEDRSSDALEFLRTGIPEQYLRTSHVNRLIRHAAYRGGAASAAECLELLQSRGLSENGGTFAAMMEVEAATVPPEGARAAVNNVWGRLLQAERLALAEAAQQDAAALPLQSYVSHCARVCSLCRVIKRLPRPSPKREEALRDAIRAYTEFLVWHRQQAEHVGKVQKGRMPQDRLLKATNQLLLAAQALRDDEGFDKVLELFTEAGLDPDIRICNNILSRANRQRAAPAVIAAMLEDMRSRTGMEPNTESFAALSRAYAQHGQVQEALDELEHCWERGGRLSCHSYGPIFSVLAELGDFRSAEVVYREMRGRKVKPDAVTFLELFKTIVRASKQMPRPQEQLETPGNLSEAEKAWHKQAVVDFAQDLEEAVPLIDSWTNDMEELGVNHTRFSVEMLVQALGNLGQLGTMLRTLGRVKASGLILTVPTYTHAVYALSKNGQLKKATALRREMERQGMQSTAATFDSLLRGCLDSDSGIDDARQIVNDMRSSVVIPDMRLYNRLIEIHMKHHDVPGAKSWLLEAQNASLKPDHRTWFVFAGEAARIGDYELMRWAVPKAAATASDPSKYRAPTGFSTLLLKSPGDTANEELTDHQHTTT